MARAVLIVPLTRSYIAVEGPTMFFILFIHVLCLRATLWVNREAVIMPHHPRRHRIEHIALYIFG